MTGAELSPQIATVCLGIGLVLALACYLTSNLSPGGMITPGWLALALVEDKWQALVIVVMTGVTYGLAKLVDRTVILYGKRQFAAVVLLSVLLQVSLYLLIQRDLPLFFSHQTLGFVAPGLIAYQLIRQPPGATLLATGAVSLATYLIVISGVVVGLVPVT